MNNQSPPEEHQGVSPLVWRTLTGTFIVLSVVLARFLGWLQPLELFCFDLMLKLRLPEPTDERIFLIEIDEADISEMGNPTKLLSQELLDLLDRVQQYKPAVIGFNILNDLIDNPEYFSQQLNLSPSRTKNVIYPEKFLPPFIYPLPEIDPEKVGFVDVFPDRDSNIRRSILGSWDFQKEETFKFSFSLLLAKLYLEEKGYELENGQIDPAAMRFGTTEIPVVYPNTGGYHQVDDGGVQTLVNYRSGKTPFNKIALRDLKQGVFDPADLENKIVIIGVTDPQKRFSLSVPNLRASKEIDGIDLQAQFASQIISAVLDNRPLIQTWGELYEYIFILLFGIPIIWSWVKKEEYISLKRIYTISIIIFFLLVTASYFSFLIAGYWLVSSTPIAMLCLNLLVHLLSYGFKSAQKLEMENQKRILEQQLEMENQKRRSEERRKVIERTFDIIHNGPLQTISMVLNNFRSGKENRAVIEQDLEDLDQEIRGISDYLKGEGLAYEQRFYLKSGYKLDLKSELHELFHQVYSETLERNFPTFKNLRIKVRSFDAIPNEEMDFETKRDLCRYLEEAICNVGKHAVNATSLTVAGKYSQGTYTLIVQDNGTSKHQAIRAGNGTEQAQKLAKKLNGSFTRDPIQDRGTMCQLKWEIRK